MVQFPHTRYSLEKDIRYEEEMCERIIWNNFTCGSIRSLLDNTRTWNEYRPKDKTSIFMNMYRIYSNSRYWVFYIKIHLDKDRRDEGNVLIESYESISPASLLSLLFITHT